MGTTPNYAIPYPEPTDFVTDGAQAMENIAEQVDAMMQAGTVARNLLYNGAMQVAQRNTSVSSITAGGYYTADRWNTDMSSSGTWTQSVENDAPTGSGFRKSLKMLCTTANASPTANAFNVFQQRLEGQDLQPIKKGTSSAQTLTASFWVKANLSGTYICELYDFNNSRQISKAYTINATNTWEYKTITFPADTTGAFANDNGLSLSINFWLATGSNFSSGTLNSTAWASVVSANRVVGQVNLAATVNNYWQITGIQMTVGSVAPPFQFKRFEQEIRECQRYYYRRTATVTAEMIISGYQPANTNIVQTWFHPSVMRANATVATFGGTWSAVNSPSSPVYSNVGTNAMNVYITVNGGIGNTNQSARYSEVGAYIEVGSEL